MKGLLLSAVLLLEGCSSVFDLAGGTEHGPHAFGGLRTWPEDVSRTLKIPMRGEAAWDYAMLYLAEGYLDIPCSLAGDILLLPVTVWFEIFRPSDPSKAP